MLFARFNVNSNAPFSASSMKISDNKTLYCGTYSGFKDLTDQGSKQTIIPLSDMKKLYETRPYNLAPPKNPTTVSTMSCVIPVSRVQNAVLMKNSLALLWDYIHAATMQSTP